MLISPQLSESNKIEAHPLAHSTKRSKRLFSMRMPDDAMIDAGINDNDLLIANPLSKPVDGSLVAVMIDNHLTVRRYFDLGHHICLAPENVNYPAIEMINQDELSICGVIVEII
ncbi:MAG: S24 family peptidase [Alphaproteobacteria bacterium]|nr:S24 family peptidase [Alphaproteobacteria bacterium]